MSLRLGDRTQVTLLPPLIDEFVSSDDPVRAYDAIIDAMGFDKLGLEINHHKVGNSNYDPVSMLKLLVYGYSYGIRSSRKLERATHHNLSFVWLMGGLKPDHKTIANFRRNNRVALKNALKQSVQIGMRLNLIEGHCLFLDGTKIKGSASSDKNKTKNALKRQLAEVDSNIDKMLLECERIDNKESGSLIKMSKELQDSRALKSKIKNTLAKMESEGLKQINKTDPDASVVKGRNGFMTGYNAQVVTDDKHGLIVSSDVVQDANDLNQFSKQISSANSNLETECKTAVADAGYSKVDDIKQTIDKGIQVIVPNQKQALHNPTDNPFNKDKFIWDAKNEEYLCPMDKRLKFVQYRREVNQTVYRIKDSQDCLSCIHYGECTTSKQGRQIKRLKNEVLKERLSEDYLSEAGQSIYKRRKSRAELPFGHIKHNMNGRQFLMRGLDLVKAEFSIFSSGFNIRRMITLLGGANNMVTALKDV